MTDSPLAQYLRLLRTTHDYKQDELASFLGITRANYSHYENARLIPPTDILCKIASFYDIPTDELIQLTLLSIEERKGEPVKKSRSRENDASHSFNQVLKAFLSKTADMPDKDLNKWVTADDREIIYHYHILSKQNKRLLKYILRIMSIMDKTAKNTD
jgi:transcriptional regulator with XRE-family HTH domain